MTRPAAVVTGANAGIGRAVAEALAVLGHPLILACRSMDRAAPVVAAIRESTGNDDVVAVRLDLSDLHDVVRCADEIGERAPIDVLVNNAGGMFSARRATPQGLEWTFSVNFLGHYLLSRLLLASLHERAPSHIVNVSSIAHRFVRDLRWDDPQLERRFSVYQAYSQSKLAQIMFTRELARRLAGTGVAVNAAHPGAVRSRLAQDGDSTGWVHGALTILTHIGITPETAARTPVMLTSVPPDETGGYWSKQRRREPSRSARDAANGERLWTISEGLIQAAGIELPPIPTEV